VSNSSDSFAALRRALLKHVRQPEQLKLLAQPNHKKFAVAETNSISAPCPKCGQRFRGGFENLYKVARCRCGHEFLWCADSLSNPLTPALQLLRARFVQTMRAFAALGVLALVLWFLRPGLPLWFSSIFCTVLGLLGLTVVMEGISLEVKQGRFSRWGLSGQGRNYQQYEMEIRAARQQFALAERAAKKAAEERIRRVAEERRRAGEERRRAGEERRREENARMARSRERLRTLPPEEFERHVGRLFEALGYEVTLTPKSNDEGIDLYLKKNSRGAIVQCKRYTSTKVSRPEIQQLYGVLHHKRANEAFLLQQESSADRRGNLRKISRST
jgi:hypothetical protein